MNGLQYIGVGICIVFLLAIPQLQYYFGSYRKEKYFKVAEDYASVAGDGAV